MEFPDEQHNHMAGLMGFDLETGRRLWEVTGEEKGSAQQKPRSACNENRGQLNDPETGEGAGRCPVTLRAVSGLASRATAA